MLIVTDGMLLFKEFVVVYFMRNIYIHVLNLVHFRDMLKVDACEVKLWV